LVLDDIDCNWTAIIVRTLVLFGRFLNKKPPDMGAVVLSVPDIGG
jgi:hypothetical protein